MITSEEITRIQQEVGRLAFQAVCIDLDGFLEAADQIGSPQALAGGTKPSAVSSAGEWAELARLLKPFRDAAATRIEQLRAEALDEGDLVELNHGCPNCGERFVDRLSIDDDTVVCGTCGTRYDLRGGEASDA